MCRSRGARRSTARPARRAARRAARWWRGLCRAPRALPPDRQRAAPPPRTRPTPTRGRGGAAPPPPRDVRSPTDRSRRGRSGRSRSRAPAGPSKAPERSACTGGASLIESGRPRRLAAARDASRAASELEAKKRRRPPAGRSRHAVAFPHSSMRCTCCFIAASIASAARPDRHVSGRRACIARWGSAASAASAASAPSAASSRSEGRKRKLNAQPVAYSGCTSASCALEKASMSALICVTLRPPTSAERQNWLAGWKLDWTTTHCGSRSPPITLSTRPKGATSRWHSELRLKVARSVGGSRTSMSFASRRSSMSRSFRSQRTKKARSLIIAKYSVDASPFVTSANPQPPQWASLHS
mmetsp:Transcript_28864/g.92483  ORF Transcript_28864/g.92483 Transcript_28864/m.92483 type:complete len:356 (-) Transcript_28864:200-1267(-)